MSLVKFNLREILSCGIAYNIILSPTILSNLYFASASIDQSYMILHPTRYRFTITKCHVVTRILIILIIVVLFMIPNHFFFHYDSKTTVYICEFHEDISHSRIFIRSIVHIVLFITIPSLISCVSSVILLHQRCSHRKLRRNSITELNRRMERNSLILVVISIIMFISILPSGILQFFVVHDLLSNIESPCPENWKTIKTLNNWFWTFLSFTYSFKFYVRISMSKTYRRDFMELTNIISRRAQNNNPPNSFASNNQNISKTTTSNL